MEGNEAFHEALRVQCQLIGGTNDLLVDDDDEINMFNVRKTVKSAHDRYNGFENNAKPCLRNSANFIY